MIAADLVPGPALLHHIHDGDRWTVTQVTGNPPLTVGAVEALRRRVLDTRHNKTDPTLWHHSEGWGAVMDLHHTGRHDDALALARLLHWCDTQANGRTQGCWEIRI